MGKLVTGLVLSATFLFSCVFTFVVMELANGATVVDIAMGVLVSVIILVAGVCLFACVDRLRGQL